MIESMEKRTMLGYGIGYIAQGNTYNFMAAYFVVFLTNCVGLSSAMAGAITSIGLLVEVLVGMVVGNLSDNCTSAMGRRRPFVLTAAFLMPIVMVLIMKTLHASTPVMFVYYLVLSILFRTAFSTFEIPNNAFGAEIATGYDERTRLRTLSRAFAIVGNTLGYVMPLWILELFPNDQEMGWQTIGIIVATVALFSWLGCFCLTKGKSAPIERREKEQGAKANVVKDIAVNYVALCKLKTMRMLIVYKAAFACAFALFNIGTIYYLKYCLGLGNKYSSYVYVFSIVIFIIMTPIANRMALQLGKTKQQMITMGISATIGFAVFFLAPDSIVGAVFYVGGFSIMQTSFWQLGSSIFYDIVEVDEFVNGTRREGDIMSLVSVLGTLITAVIVQIFGILLDQRGFSADLLVQPQTAIEFLNVAYILVPSICFVIGFISLKVFPINRESFQSLQDALECKKNGESYDAYRESLQKIL